MLCLVFVDGAQLPDLCCFWTGTNQLPTRSTMLIAKFDDSGDILLPMAESCFLSLTLPVKHTTFPDFVKHMDLALKYGYKGFCFS